MKSGSAITLTREPNTFAKYGAFELKRSYQRNLSIALVIAAALHLVIIGGFLIISSLSSKPPEARGVVRIKTIAELAPPPSLSQTQAPQVAVAAPGVAPPSVGIPQAVKDEEAPKDVTIASQEELGKIQDLSAQSIIGGAGGDSIAIDIPAEEYLPSAEEFTPYDEPPVQLNEITYDYPPLARQAGIEGTVWIKALVDKNGNVRDAVIFKTSGSSAGFEDIAKEGAFKIKFKPAISNKQPVAVWVVYPVHFKLSK
jgi:protein TonB